jgi:hypothetical protein
VRPEFLKSFDTRKDRQTAVPVLKEDVGNDDLSAIGRSNAAKVLFIEASNHLKVVKLTSNAAQSSRDPEASDALKKVANLMASYCEPDLQRRCKDAANDN